MSPRLRGPELRYAVRRGLREDAAAVRSIFMAALVEHAFDEVEWNVNPEITSFGAKADPLRDDFVLVDANKVVGFLILLPKTARTGELSKLFVAPEHRRRGGADLLMRAALTAAQAHGYRQLVLETHVAFAAARRYYERRGWRRLAALPFSMSPTTSYVLDLLAPGPGPQTPQRGR